MVAEVVLIFHSVDCLDGVSKQGVDEAFLLESDIDFNLCHVVDEATERDLKHAVVMLLNVLQYFFGFIIPKVVLLHVCYDLLFSYFAHDNLELF